jgi:hypothetical protein
MNADQIEEIVSKLLILKKEGKSKEEIDLLSEFNEFKTNNKLFYNTIINGEFDKDIFKKMMNYKRKIENGEDKYGVDVKFGYYMSEKYIDPVIKK